MPRRKSQGPTRRKSGFSMRGNGKKGIAEAIESRHMEGEKIFSLPACSYTEPNPNWSRRLI
eukprot:755378-Hanusia_phi.AAC.3